MPDYIASASDALPTTPIARWDANMAAIRTLKALEAEDRAATPAEQSVLAQYSGFGDSAFEQGFSPYVRDQAWKGRAEALRELVTDEEYNAISQSRLNAFYTSPEVIRTMWRGLDEMGASDIPKLRVLEPSAGSGRFLGYQARETAERSTRTAVELDNLTAGILERLYPDVTVWNMGFQDAPLPNDTFDVAISNVPFGNYGVHDPGYLGSGRKFLTGSIHNYFFAKTLDKLRPGGVLAFVTTHHTMDAEKARRVREYLAERADLVGAVRLPEDAFPDTQVVTDIIYLRKRRPGEEPGDTSWVDTGPVSVPGRYGQPIDFPVNQYFIQNPEMVLGGHSAEGTMYRDDSYTVQREPGSAPLRAALAEAVGRVADSPLGISTVEASPSARPPQPPRGDSAATQTVPGQGPLSARDEARVRGMSEIRDTARMLLDLEAGDLCDEEACERARTDLREQYQRFVDRHGTLNDHANRKLMTKDPDAPMLLALEVYNKDTKNWVPSAIFSRRVIGGVPEAEVASVSDALSVTVNESGSLDFNRMGELMGQSPVEVQQALSEANLIFHNPMGNWETADEYLTGPVREKLRIARQVASKNPAYQGNVEALEAVQPKDIPAGEIDTPLGAPWIPDSVVNAWVSEHWNVRRPDNWFNYSEELGQWSNPRTVPALSATLHSEWGTPEMGGDKILLHVLQGSPITVYQSDGQGGRERDLEGTLAAQEKAVKIQESFSDWIWRDPDRTADLVRQYNDIHNSTRTRVFDGSHLVFPGMSLAWQRKLRPHQRDAIFRVVHDGTALLAHEVGFGKTAVMVAAAMERKRLGLADKSIFVVPKATHSQFVRQFQELYPNAALLFPDDKDFTNENRGAFLSRIATGNWDGVILTGEQFQKIPVAPATEANWISAQLDDLRSAYADIAADRGRRGSRTQKQMQKKIASLEVKLKDLRSEIRESADKRVTYFENLGIDQLYVDEADRYKNLPFATQMGQVKGLPNSESKRAWDMFLKVQNVQGKGARPSGYFARNGVVFATGTPIANTIAEAWTMMRYLQLPELRRRGLHHFDPWAKTYGRVTSGLEQTPQGQYKVTQRFAKFVNLPELSRLFQNVADVRVASEVPEMLAAQPRLVDSQGNPKRITVVAPSHDVLQEYMKNLRERVDKLRTVAPSVDNMLLITSDARKAALDMRMVDSSAPANPTGKIQLAARNIDAIYDSEAADKGTQLVFLDIGTPKAKEKVDDSGEPPGEEATAAEARHLSDVYSVLKRDLIAQGVPESQIAFIHDYKGDKAREKLFEKVRDGDVRVLVGSTETIGVGVNVQDRAAALHHLDVPWRPRDIEQREGRIIRQGNEVYGPVYDDETGEIVGPGRGVKIYQYVQEGSFDEFMWQAVEVKGQAVKALLKRDMAARSMEDVDPLVLGAAEAKALASGNPLVLRAEELKNRVNTLRLERAAHRNQTSNAAAQVARLEPVIDGYRRRIPLIEQDARVASNTPDGDALTVNGRSFESRATAGEAIQAALKDLSLGASREIGEYKAFDISSASTDRGYQLTVSNPSTAVPYHSAYIEEISPTGLVGSGSV